MFQQSTTWPFRVILSLLILAVFTALAFLLEPYVATAPILLLFSSTVLCALYCGQVLGLIAAIVGTLMHDYYFQFPKLTLRVHSTEDLFELLLFLVAALFVATAGASVRRAKDEALKSMKEAEDASRARDELLAMVTHDLKNPLTAIQLNASMIKRVQYFEPSSPIARGLEMINHTSARMLRLISDLLDYEKIRAGRFDIDLKPQDMRTIFEEVREVMSPLIQDKSQTIEYRLPLDDIRVMGDRDRIVQVFSNLIGNATKFTNVGGKITVGCHLAGRELECFVQDTGPGIPEEQLRHVFDRYWQARHTARHGTGLGLSIVKGIVDGHRGKIWVKSKVGEGSVFFVSIPLAG